MSAFDGSFTAAGCENARFASLSVFRDEGSWVRRQQAAIVARRAALVAGQDPDEAAFDLLYELTRLGMSGDEINEHVADPCKDIAGFFLSASDLGAR